MKRAALAAPLLPMFADVARPQELERDLEAYVSQRLLKAS
jgi:hypothetical protein